MRHDHPMERLLRWIVASSHRRLMLEAVARLNAEGALPDAARAIRASARTYPHESARTGARLAIHRMLDGGVLENHAPPKRPMRLAVGPAVKVLSDWQEEQGYVRLDADYAVLVAPRLGGTAALRELSDPGRDG